MHNNKATQGRGNRNVGRAQCCFCRGSASYMIPTGSCSLAETLFQFRELNTSEGSCSGIKMEVLR